MPSLFIIGHLKTSGGAARTTVLDALTTVSKYSAAHEPGVYKFCVAIPRDGDNKSVFAIEEYADQAAMDKHMASSAVADLLKTFGSDPSLFAQAPAIYGLPTKLEPSASFTRAALSTLSDPYILFANFEYKAGIPGHAIGGWNDVVAHAEQNERSTMSLTSIEDAEKGWIRTIEVYDDVDFLGPIMGDRKTIHEKRNGSGDAGIGEKEVWKLKMVAGYLHKEQNKSRL